MKENIFILIIMIIIVPLAGELKFYPFHDAFRVSFATPAFFLLLLCLRKIPLILCGFLVGISVVTFRILLDLLITPNVQLNSIFMVHLPTFFYYAAYSTLFYLAKINRMHSRPLLIGILSVFIEITSNMVELYFRHVLLGNIINLSTSKQIIIIAIIRSFFALAFFTIIKLHEAKLTVQQQQQQNNHMLLLISNLFEESIQLKKSSAYAEDITKSCYNLYRLLQENNSSLKKEELAKNLLSIAGQIHEIKKDNQRIYAGLAKMISEENSTDYMDMLQVGDIIVHSNKKYADFLSKDINIILNIEDKLPPLHVYTILSILNNLVSNAVEAINDKGLIKISIRKTQDLIEFKVCDNGIGIPEKKKNLIFKPGYTTKYDTSGNASTGMGLPYVKELVEKLKGSILLENKPYVNETVFTITLPINSLVKK